MRSPPGCKSRRTRATPCEVAASNSRADTVDSTGDSIKMPGHMDGTLKVFSGSAHPELARAICEQIGIPLGKSKTHRFSNENLKVKIEENVREQDVFVVQTSSPPVSEGIVELLIMIDALKSASARRITAVMPYFPYVRSDK